MTGLHAAVTPLPNATCPLCGGPNECAVARCGRFDVECWCTSVVVSPQSLARVPEPQRRLSCLCPRCAAAPPRDDPAIAFDSGAYRARALHAADVPALQRFFERNPEYFLAVTGRPPRPDEAQQEFDDLPPAGMPWRGRRLLAFADAHDEPAGMASLLSDFLADGVWHIGLFIVATSLHGRGVAPALYRALEDWMAGQGARWIRLGAVVGNERAERFWRSAGYVEVRQRTGVVMGARTNTVRVLVKPLAGGGVADYLQRVERDRPESTLP